MGISVSVVGFKYSTNKIKKMKSQNRFRIFDADMQSLVGKYETTQQVYETLKDLDLEDCRYFIDDTIDDIEVGADEFVQAWEFGERPQDLQMF